MRSATVTFRTSSGDVAVPADLGANLLEVAQQADVAIDAPCGGNGTCGKCRVRVLEGTLESEDALGLSPAAKAAGWYLACKSSIVGDVVVELSDAAAAWQTGLKVADVVGDDDQVWHDTVALLEMEGHWPDWEGDALLIELEPPSTEDTTSDLQRFSDALARTLGVDKPPLVPLGLARALPGLLRENDFKVLCLLRKTKYGPRLIALLPYDSLEVPYALACDIGTTGVSMILIDLMKGTVLASASAGNGQIRYGADIINRIIRQARPGGISRLREAIVDQTLNPLIEAVCKRAGVSSECISHMAIAGNTTMMHLLLGVEADPLRKEPFVPCFYDIEGLRAGDIGLTMPIFAPVYVAPSVGSYVGGDITAGLLPSGLWQSEELRLFVDLGTNGELVFGNNEFLMTCACSAGPAFEGGDIKNGMRAVDGAIEAAIIDAQTLDPHLTVIGGGKPTGICGSGLIDLVSELFRGGAIDGKGRFIAQGRRFSRDVHGIGSYTVAFAEETALGHEVVLTEVDLENFIRAKGAIFSAITVMLDATGFSVTDISRVIVAGGIGSGIDIGNAIAIGLFPDIAQDRYAYLGNTSLIGARAMAQSPRARAKVKEIASGMTYLELSNEPGYMDAFIAACFLPHTDASLFPSSRSA